MKKAVCLLSGGLDSTTTVFYAKNKGYEIYALTFSYGQRHSKEVEQAEKVAKYLGVKEHKIININFLKELTKGVSALTDEKIEIPEERKIEDMEKNIPVTYVPFRNTIFLSIATSYAESINANSIFIGANSLDYSGYPDCRPEYFKAMEEVIKLGTKIGVTNEKEIKIEIPLLMKTKSEIIKLAKELNVPLGLTWSCYKGGKKACGKCDSCLLRLKGFKEAGIKDPIEYENK